MLRLVHEIVFLHWIFVNVKQSVKVAILSMHAIEIFPNQCLRPWQMMSWVALRTKWTRPLTKEFVQLGHVVVFEVERTKIFALHACWRANASCLHGTD
jgi:hypothetical protein